MLTFRDRGLIAEGAQFMMTYTDVKVQGDQLNMAVGSRNNYLFYTYVNKIGQTKQICY